VHEPRYLIGLDGPPGDRLDDRDDPLPEPLVGHAEHQAVFDVLVEQDDLLHLLGEHLLTAGVDRGRAAPDQRDGAVLVPASPVAGQHVTLPIDRLERARGALRVVPVAAAAGREEEQPDFPAVGRDDAAVGAKEPQPRARDETVGARGLAAPGHLGPDRRALARTARVDQGHLRYVLEQLLLDLAAPRHPGRGDRDEAGRVIRRAHGRLTVKRSQHRPRESVADDGHSRGPVPGDRREQLIGVEVR
jgi:hypothetical protein